MTCFVTCFLKSDVLHSIFVYDELASSNMFILLVSAEPSAGRAVCMNKQVNLCVCVCVGGQVCSEINSSLRTEGVLSQYE